MLLLIFQFLSNVLLYILLIIDISIMSNSMQSHHPHLHAWETKRIPSMMSEGHVPTTTTSTTCTSQHGQG